jgi:sterol 22-desaturase
MYTHPHDSSLLTSFDRAAFQHGPKHQELRHSFLPLFNRKALGVYLGEQTAIISAHIKRWLSAASAGPAEARTLLRDMNQETSQVRASELVFLFPHVTDVTSASALQHVFVGSYLDDPAQFSRWYTAITDGFLSVPIYFPGTTLWKAVDARKKVREEAVVWYGKANEANA